MLSSQNSLPHHMRTINDGVMGGLSTSQVSVSDQGIHFSGNVSLANNGGFASMRGQWPLKDEPNKQKPVDEAIKLTVKGDGQRYQFRLYTSDNRDGSAYVFSFDTRNGETTTVIAPLTEFKPQWRGRGVTKPPLKLQDIMEYGLLIGDKQSGEFNILLKSISLLEK